MLVRSIVDCIDETISFCSDETKKRRTKGYAKNWPNLRNIGSFLSSRQKFYKFKNCYVKHKANGSTAFIVLTHPSSMFIRVHTYIHGNMSVQERGRKRDQKIKINKV